MTKWEYREVKMVESGREKALNELGAEGWELIAIKTSISDLDRFFFKRPKP